MIAYSTDVYITANQENSSRPLRYLLRPSHLNLLNTRILALNSRLHQHCMAQDQYGRRTDQPEER